MFRHAGSRGQERTITGAIEIGRHPLWVSFRAGREARAKGLAHHARAIYG
jgi:hypothetical protein